MAKVAPEDTRKVSNIIENVGTRLGLKVLRADREVNIRAEVEKKVPHTYTYDGVHTNPSGARLIADYICSYIIPRLNSQN